MQLVGGNIWAGICEVEKSLWASFPVTPRVFWLRGVGWQWMQFYFPHAQTLQLGSDPWQCVSDISPNNENKTWICCRTLCFGCCLTSFSVGTFKSRYVSPRYVPPSWPRHGKTAQANRYKYKSAQDFPNCKSKVSGVAEILISVLAEALFESLKQLFCSLFCPNGTIQAVAGSKDANSPTYIAAQAMICLEHIYWGKPLGASASSPLLPTPPYPIPGCTTTQMRTASARGWANQPCQTQKLGVFRKKKAHWTAQAAAGHCLFFGQNMKRCFEHFVVNWVMRWKSISHAVLSSICPVSLLLVDTF